MDKQNSLGDKIAKVVDDAFEEAAKKPNRKPFKDGLSEENWEEEFRHVPLFTSETPTAEDFEASPALQALQALKYESEDPEAVATEHKEDGNVMFKKGDDKRAIAAYTEGLKQKCENKGLNAILYTNRAAAQFHLKNFASSLEDAKEALKLKPDHVKAILRAAQCCQELEKYSEAVDFCDEGLQILPTDKKFQELRKNALASKKAQEKDRRKRNVEAKRKRLEDERLLKAVKDRNIRLGLIQTEDSVGESTDDQMIASLQSSQRDGYCAFLDANDVLYWPVRFLYPEHNQSDVIEGFDERARFSDHLEFMFSPDEEVPWDPEKLYKPQNLEVYFEDYDAGALVKVKQSRTLKKVMQDNRFQVYHGIPCFMVLSNQSDFMSDYLQKFTLVC